MSAESNFLISVHCRLMFALRPCSAGLNANLASVPCSADVVSVIIIIIFNILIVGIFDVIEDKEFKRKIVPTSKIDKLLTHNLQFLNQMCFIGPRSMCFECCRNYDLIKVGAVQLGQL